MTLQEQHSPDGRMITIVIGMYTVRGMNLKEFPEVFPD
jgi:hypothetical protein